MFHDPANDATPLPFWSRNDPAPLSESTFTILRDLIHAKTGLYYDLNKQDILANKLLPRLHECNLTSFLDYYYLLKYDEDRAYDEWKQVMNALAVPETFFWREIDPIHALVTTILPQWVKEHPQQTFRIWSAACSTGEEPLTIAMMLEEAGWFERCAIELYASDASQTAIAAARQGLYRPRSFRMLPDDLKARYFLPQPNPVRPDQTLWRIKPHLHQRVRWSVTNLVNGWELSAMVGVSCIFCRNVFIYFSEQAIEKTVGHFWDLMPTPGYLVISSSESLLKLKTQFVFTEVNGALLYCKHAG